MRNYITTNSENYITCKRYKKLASNMLGDEQVSLIQLQFWAQQCLGLHFSTQFIIAAHITYIFSTSLCASKYSRSVVDCTWVTLCYFRSYLGLSSYFGSVRGHNFRPPIPEYSQITTPNIFHHCETLYAPTPTTTPQPIPESISGIFPNSNSEHTLSMQNSIHHSISSTTPQSNSEPISVTTLIYQLSPYLRLRLADALRDTQESDLEM